MQLQGLMFMLFILLIIPVLAISTNHYIFFGIMSIILIIASLRSIYTRFFDSVTDNDDENDDETQEEIEDILNIDMKKFGKGIYVIKDLFVILFFLYCSFYLNAFILKINASILMLIKVYEIKNTVMSENPGEKDTSLLSRNISLASSILSLVLIGFTLLNLVFEMNF